MDITTVKTKYVLFLFLIFLTSLYASGNKVKIKIKDNIFLAEIANTPELRRKGLMFRESIKRNEAMLFIFPKKEKLGFWMKNTKINVDILYFDENFTLVNLYKNVIPCSKVYLKPGAPCPTYYSIYDAKYVVELKAGIADKINIEKGDVLKILTDKRISSY